MKPKSFGKKLTLKKETITHLENQDQDNLRGGTNGRNTSAVICEYPTQCYCTAYGCTTLLPEICGSNPACHC